MVNVSFRHVKFLTVYLVSYFLLLLLLCSSWSLRDCKQLLRRYLSRLELAGLASSSNAYQSVVTAIAQDLCHKGLYRQQRARELVSFRNTIASLDSKTRALQEQVDFYNEYIHRCLDNLNAGKKYVISICISYLNFLSVPQCMLKKLLIQLLNF